MSATRVSSGLDLALWIVERPCGSVCVARIEQQIEYEHGALSGGLGPAMRSRQEAPNHSAPRVARRRDLVLRLFDDEESSAVTRRPVRCTRGRRHW